jgi:hypothetical protein
VDPVRCDACGEPLAIGDYPFCPHGRGGQTVIGDDIPGGQWFENGFSTPQKFYSHSDHVKALDREGLQIAPRWREGSKHLTRWVSVDLAAATALVSRGATPAEGPGGLALLEAHPDYPITVSDAGWSLTVKETT